MSSVMASRPDYHQELVKRFEKLPFYPLGCKNWEELCVRMHLESDKADPVYAFSLLEKPKDEGRFGGEVLTVGRPFDPKHDYKKVFGLRNDHQNGLIGDLWFYFSRVTEHGFEWEVKWGGGLTQEEFTFPPGLSTDTSNYLSWAAKKVTK
jgi:hypothetical protein